MFEHRRLFILFMLIVGLFVLIMFSGCSNEITEGKNQELIIGYGKDTRAYTDSKWGPGFMVKTLVGERLVELNGEKIKPSLASSYDIKDGGKTIVFYLRKDVTFSDGTPLTAEAVEFTYKKLKHLKQYSWTEVDRIKEMEVIDPHTVAFHYKEGQEGYIALTAFNEYHWTVFSPNSVKPAGDITGKFVNTTGTGPWKVAKYVEDQFTIFVPNEHYRGQRPKLDKITIKVVPDAESRVLALRSGDVDVVVDYYHGGSAYTPRNLLNSLENDGFQVIEREMPITNIIRFNYEKAPWNDVRVRKAVNYAINKDEIAALFDNWVRPAKEALLCDLAPFSKEAGVKTYLYDAEKAKQLLRESGFADGLTAKLIIRGENPDHVKLGELIQDQLAKVGIQVKLSVLEGGAYSEKRDKGDYDLMIYYIGGPERRRYTRIDGRFNPNAPEFKFGAYHASEITPVLDKAVRSFNENERREAFKEFYRLVHEHAAVVPLYYDAVFVVADKKVKGIEYVGSEPNFQKIFLSK